MMTIDAVEAAWILASTALCLKMAVPPAFQADRGLRLVV